MNRKEQIAKPRLIAYFLFCLLPLTVILFGIFLLMKDTLFNVTFAIGFLFLPLITAVVLFFLIFSMVKRWKKIILSIFLLVVFVVSFFAITVLGKMEMLSRYENEVAVWHEKLPERTEIGEPEKIEYYDYFSSVVGIFTCDTDTLICQYDAEQYAAQKALLEEKYVFQTEEGTAEVGKYIFRIVEGEHYPKEILFVATNEHTREIVYMFFYDDDLDDIESLQDFLYDDCGWKYIR